MVVARLHVICGNCGRNDMFVYSVYDDGEGESPCVNLRCRNCATLHNLHDNADWDGVRETNNRRHSEEVLKEREKQ